jgi:hypothetical protein
VGNTDQSVAQLLRLINRHGRHLLDRADWQVLTTEETFTSVATASQGLISAIFSTGDYHRIVNHTMFDRSNNERIYGPFTPEQWQRDQAWSTSPTSTYFRIRGNAILFTPTPAAGNTIACEYISNLWNETSGGTGQSAFAADTDVGRLDEELLTLGAIWRFLKAKGFDYAEAFREHELALDRVLGNDGGKPKINMAPEALDPTMVNFPDGSWSL